MQQFRFTESDDSFARFTTKVKKKKKQTNQGHDQIGVLRKKKIPLRFPNEQRGSNKTSKKKKKETEKKTN